MTKEERERAKKFIMNPKKWQCHVEKKGIICPLKKGVDLRELGYIDKSDCLKVYLGNIYHEVPDGFISYKSVAELLDDGWEID